jgi:hypothetical protein
MNIAIYLFALFLGITTARSGTIAARGNVQPPNLAYVLISFAANTATFGLIALGFFFFSWWVPIVSFIGISFLVGVVVTRSSWVIFWKILPITGLLTLWLCLYGCYVLAVR